MLSKERKEKDNVKKVVSCTEVTDCSEPDLESARVCGSALPPGGEVVAVLAGASISTRL